MFYCNKYALKNDDIPSWCLSMPNPKPLLKEKSVEEKKPTAADKPGDTAIGALRWLDRNATIIKAGNSPVFAEKFDKALDLL